MTDMVSWWITAIELPVLGGLLMLLLKVRKELSDRIDDALRLLEARNAQLRDALSNYKLEAMKTYAPLSDVRTLENRLVAHLLRIESKLDATALKTAALVR